MGIPTGWDGCVNGSTGEITSEGLLRLTEEYLRIQRDSPKVPEVIIMTSGTYQKLKESTESGSRCDLSTPYSDFAGIRVEHYSTFSECQLVAREYSGQGRYVMLCARPE